MNKKDLPSERQAIEIAVLWAKQRPCNVMKEPREGEKLYNDATIVALIRKGWIKPSGALCYRENGYLWEPHQLTEAGEYALEMYLAQLRWERHGAAQVQQGSG